MQATITEVESVNKKTETIRLWNSEQNFKHHFRDSNTTDSR